MKHSTKMTMVVLMIFTLLFNAACSNNTKVESSTKGTASTGGEEEKEVVTLKVFMSAANMPTNIVDNPQMKEIEKRIGIKLDFSPYTGGGDAKQKLGTLIASNELPDLIFNDDVETNNLLLQNDLILPLDELLQSHGQEVERNIKPGLDHSRAMFSNDTNQLYFIPNLVGEESVYPSGYDLVFQLRGDLLKKTGLGDPKNFDELLNYAIEANKLEPQTDEGLTTYLTGIPFAEHNGFDYVDWNESHYRGKVQVGGFSYLDMETK